MEFDFNWGSLAGTVAQVAPQLGQILGAGLGSAGGPLGKMVGSSIGGIAGRAIAAKFGVEATPEEVGNAIRNDPKATEKLQELEEERGAELKAEAEARIEEARELTKRLQIEAEDRQSARALAWDPSRQRTPMAKFQIAFGSSFVLGFFVILILFMVRPATTLSEAAILMLGVLTGVVKDISQFYFGSSASSQSKDTALKAIATETVAETSRVAARVEAGKVATRKTR